MNSSDESYTVSAPLNLSSPKDKLNTVRNFIFSAQRQHGDAASLRGGKKQVMPSPAPYRSSLLHSQHMPKTEGTSPISKQSMFFDPMVLSLDINKSKSEDLLAWTEKNEGVKSAVGQRLEKLEAHVSERIEKLDDLSSSLGVCQDGVLHVTDEVGQVRQLVDAALTDTRMCLDQQQRQLVIQEQVIQGLQERLQGVIVLNWAQVAVFAMTMVASYATPVQRRISVAGGALGLKHRHILLLRFCLAFLVQYCVTRQTHVKRIIERILHMLKSFGNKLK